MGERFIIEDVWFFSSALFAIKLEELYSMKCSSIFGMRGNAEYINLSLEFLNPKYTEESMYESSLNFLREILFNPHVDNEKFDESLGSHHCLTCI